MSKKPISAPDLYQQLLLFQFSSTDDTLSFEQRLAEENNWSSSYVKKVIVEYKRFLFLAVTCSHSVTPSWEVDQAWHLHLLYSRSYWDELCNQVLQFPLHHNPTKGGDNQGKKFFNDYTKTLESYKKTFSTPPPNDIWPTPEQRFNIKVETHSHDTQRSKICVLSKIIWSIHIIVTMSLLFIFSFGISLAFLVIGAILISQFIIGHSCPNCCQFHAFVYVHTTPAGNKELQRCQYCGFEKMINKKTASSGTCGGGGGGCGGGCGGG